MKQTVYIYGSARNATTRTLRRSTLPREHQVRFGPGWVIRPGRRTPVQLSQLVPYENVVFKKMAEGTIQIQDGDQHVIPEEKLRELFAALRGSPEMPDYTTMPFAELFELMRAETPAQDAWDAFVVRAFAEDAEDLKHLPDMRTRIRALRERAEKLRGVLNVDNSLIVISAAEETERQREIDERMAEEKAARERELEAEKKAEEERAAGMSIPERVDPEQMDFTPPAEPPAEPIVEDVEQPQETETAPEAESELVADLSEEPAVEEQPVAEEPTSREATPEEQRAAKEAQLPEGWRTFTNSKLVELLGELNIEIPARQNKPSLVGAVEAWLEGS